LAHRFQSVENGDRAPYGKISNGKNVSENRRYYQVVRLEVFPPGVDTTLADSSPNFRKQGRRVKAEHWKFVRPVPVLPDQCVKWPGLRGLPVCEFAQEGLNGEAFLPSFVRAIGSYGVSHDPFHRLRGLEITYSFLL